MNQDRLFVYGTLRRGQQNHHLLGPSATYLGQACMRGARLYSVAGAYYPVAVASSDPRDVVIGELYSVSDPSVFRELDEFEEALGPDPLFRREQVNILAADGGEVSSWVYLYNQPTQDLSRIPSGDFLIRDQLERARASDEAKGFMRLAGTIDGPKDLSRRKGFFRS